MIVVGDADGTLLGSVLNSPVDIETESTVKSARSWKTGCPITMDTEIVRAWQTSRVAYSFSYRKRRNRERGESGFEN
jgi:hypothetical protein